MNEKIPVKLLKTPWGFARHYWQLSIALSSLIVALILQFTGFATIGHWLLGIVSLTLTVPLLMGMWDDLRNGSYGIDILAATAIVTSVLLHQYWAAIVIVIMLTGGEGLEDYADHRAHAELDALLKHAPSTAHVYRGRKVVDVAVHDIEPNDRILIKAGEVVPADATVLEGSASFDESSLTGESLPQTRDVGDQILSGSINLDGSITAKALHSAKESQYEQIIRLVKSAGTSQAPFVRLADRYSIPFTVAAYAVAGSAWLIGHHAIRFLEVIVVATPCPLLLAAPIALISGMSRASKYGIIVKNGSALERLAEAETFAFDKTGTLTRGEPVVQKVAAFAPFTGHEVLALAAGLEQGSAHVLAKAILQAADKQKVRYAKTKHVRDTAGYGLEAVVKGKQVLVGTAGLMERHGVELPKSVLAAALKQTATYIASNGKLAGVITFEDKLRPETKRTLELLEKLGVRHSLMLTGDNEVTAMAIAKELGIEDVRANALPADKLLAIEKLTHRPVAFVGDGVNDAPVLTASDIGIALGARGSAAASESADIVIMQDDFSLVAKALAIAGRTFSIARQSILVGIALSLILMLIFATGHFPPLLGAILQEFVDVVVIFNALRAHSGKLLTDK